MVVVLGEVGHLGDAAHDHGFGVEVILIVHHVGGDEAGIAPFIPQDGGEHPRVMGRVGRADTVEGDHDRQTLGVAEAALEAPQVGFTEFLFCHVGGNTAAVMLLVIEAHMLGAVHDALFGAALEDGVADAVGQHGVFGDVLIVAAVVGGAALGQARAPQVEAVQPQAAVAFDQAPGIGQLGVEGGPHQGLGMDVELVGLAGGFVGIAGGEAADALVLHHHGILHVGQGIGGTAAVNDRADGFIDGDFMHQVVPVSVIDIVPLLVLDAGGVEANALIHAFGGGGIGLYGVGFALEFGDPFVLLRAVRDLDFYFIVIDGIGAFPVLTA